MQVHKEVIDKVPNSLPNRSDIEVEIYGMEGIPALDIKEHEKNKSKGAVPRPGSPSSGEDEPAPKKNKPESSGNGSTTSAAPVQIPMIRPAMPGGMMPGMAHPGMFAHPGMHPMMGPMGPFMPPG